MFRAQIISYFTHIYYNLRLVFEYLSFKKEPVDEIDDGFDEFIDIDDIESDRVALLRQNR